MLEPFNQNIFQLCQLELRVARWRHQHRRIVLTNGCFDLLHPGHIRGLRYARSLGDLLIVATNDDESISRIKGPGRPIMPLHTRMEMLACIRWVDAVVAFGEDDASAVVSVLKPDIYVKGKDYDLESTPEGKLVLAYGGVLSPTPYWQGLSSSGIIKQIRAGKAGSEDAW